MRKDWEYKKLGECFHYIKNGANIKQVKGAGGYPITRIETLSGGVFNRNRMGYADVYDIEKYQDYILENGDLLLSHINSKSYIGRTVEYRSRNTEIIIHGMNLLRIKNNSDVISSSFFAYYANSHKFKSDIARIRKDAVNQSSLSITDLKKIHVPLPPKPTQLAIVAELDKINELIQLKKQQLKDYDQLAQSIFYEMFGDPVENEKGWEVKKLGEICDIRDGTHDSPKYVEHSDYLLITSKNIENNLISFENVNYITEEDFLRINKRSKVDDGDIIMPMIGTIGNPIIVKLVNNINFAIKNVALIKFYSTSSVINYYLQSLMKSSSFEKDITRFHKGGTQKFIALGTIRNFKIPLPPLPLQQQFAARIEAIERQKQQVSETIKDLETLLASRMQYWFD